MISPLTFCRKNIEAAQMEVEHCVENAVEPDLQLLLDRLGDASRELDEIQEAFNSINELGMQIREMSDTDGEE